MEEEEEGRETESSREIRWINEKYEGDLEQRTCERKRKVEKECGGMADSRGRGRINTATGRGRETYVEIDKKKKGRKT